MTHIQRAQRLQRDLRIALIVNAILLAVTLAAVMCLAVALSLAKPAHGQGPTPIPLDTPSASLATPIPLSALEPYDNPAKPAWCYGLKWPASKTYPCGFRFWKEIE